MRPAGDGRSQDTPAQPEEPAVLRQRMVDLLVAAGTVTDAEVERALRTVPRHLFLPGIALDQAYADIAVATHWEGGIAVSSASQPAIVAIMLQQLRVEPGMRVLEVGAGTGYNAALLAELVGAGGSVISLDIDPVIVAEAVEHLTAAGYSRVGAIAADGAAGWRDGAPYDRIILTVGAADVAPAWVEQLAADGVLVLPLWLGSVEASVAFRKQDGGLLGLSLAPCGFMRLRGAEAGDERWVALPNGRKLFTDRAADIAEPVARLLATRPRRRFWAFPGVQLVPYIGLLGHRLVTLSPPEQPFRKRRALPRWGIYAEGADGPSLVLFAPRLPLALAYGGVAAEVAVEAARETLKDQRTGAIENWRIAARPRGTATAAPPLGAHRLVRRHFVFDIWPTQASDTNEC
ncbi:MAG: Protein-L-isoaspartate O-methyltransferase [Ktedonobacterales bacterium]|nr:MAG: Protein-L-isoaspartate O-methyltransferase [Ktedonobacterales bacterium]